MFVEQPVQFTIFLPTVESVSDASGMMQHKLTVAVKSFLQYASLFFAIFSFSF